MKTLATALIIILSQGVENRLDAGSEHFGRLLVQDEKHVGRIIKNVRDTDELVVFGHEPLALSGLGSFTIPSGAGTQFAKMVFPDFREGRPPIVEKKVEIPQFYTEFKNSSVAGALVVLAHREPIAEERSNEHPNQGAQAVPNHRLPFWGIVDSFIERMVVRYGWRGVVICWLIGGGLAWCCTWGPYLLIRRLRRCPPGPTPWLNQKH